MASIAGPPKQQRSRDSLERLLSAGLEMLDAPDVDGFTIAAVADRAGVGVALVYRRFADKDALLAALLRRFTDQTVAALKPEIAALESADRSLETLVHSFVGVVASMFRDRENLMRAFMALNRGTPALSLAVQEGIRTLTSLMEPALLRHRDEFRCTDPEFAVTFCSHQTLVTFAALVATNDAHSEIRWDETAGQLSAMTLAYLRAEPASACVNRASGGLRHARHG